MTEQQYKEHFKVSDEMLRRLMEIALSRGGDYADLYFEHTVVNELALRDGEVNSAGTHVDYGVGIRVLKGEKTGYAYAESTDWEDMKAAAENAAQIALTPASFCPDYSASAALLSGVRRGEYYNAVVPFETCTASMKLPYLKRLGDRIYALDSRVVQVIARVTDSTSHIMMYNSFSELACDTRPVCSIMAMAVFAGPDGKTETNSASRSFRMGFEMLTDEIVEEMALRTVRGMDERFEAIRPKGGEMPVVMGAGGSGILLHEAVGHAFEADFVRKKQSIFSEKIGQKICDSAISIVDDATVYANRGAVNVDDEGVPGQKTYMVREGVLASFLHDRISAAHFGVAPTGNGRRESFRYQPIPRMRATYMEGGSCTADDMIAEVKNGIYVDDFSNGQVKIGEGDFTFYVKNGRLIENGRLTAPVKDINVIGNGPKALADIIAVGSDPLIDNGTWTCGKGQSCLVSCGIPTVLVRSLTVGGDSEA